MFGFPHNWFWIVAGNEAQWYSSATGGYVAPVQAFIDDGKRPTRIASEDELWEVLAKNNVLNRQEILDKKENLAADGYLNLTNGDLKRFTETLFRAIKAANPSMTIPTRAQVKQAWKDSG